MWSLAINCARYLIHTSPFNLKQTTLYKVMCSRHTCNLSTQEAGKEDCGKFQTQLEFS